MHGRDEAKIDAVVDEIGSKGGRAIGVSAEVTDFAATERMRERVEEELGPVEVLAAFAASGGPLRDRQWRSARKDGAPLWTGTSPRPFSQ